ncbi:MAG: hypothetical protein K2L13_02855 [Opitutales bacterium]|nr:hypothetical protein [Opitutales bacterium]
MNKREKIVFCDVDDDTRAFLNTSQLLKQYEVVMLEDCLDKTPANIIEKNTDAVVISTFVYSKLSGDLLKKFPHLRMISTRSTGYNNVDLEYCKAHNISVVNVVGYGEITVAEYALGMLLDLTRKISFSNKKLREGHVDVNGDIGIDLSGKTIGVIGTGAIGRHFVKICYALGCTILTYDPFQNQALIDSGMCRYTSLDEIFQKSDVISLHCPSTEENYHMINEASIKKMKHGVFIVNTARGELIDALPLYDAIISGKIAGAALDVLDHENAIIKHDIESVKHAGAESALYSLINEKLLQLPNVIITPHIAFNSSDAIRRILETSVKNIHAFLCGEQVKSVW